MSGPAGDPAPRRRRRLGRGPLLGGVLLFAAIAALATTQGWVGGAVDDPVLGHRSVSLPGREVAPAGLGLALAAGAAGLAAALTGRIARIVAGIVVAGCGLGIAAAAVVVLTDPTAALAGGAGGGLGRADAVPVSDVAVTPWVLVALGVGALLTLAGAAVVVLAPRWHGLSDRYEQPAEHADADGNAPAGTRRDRPETAASDWDRLSRGEDPTR